LDYVWTRGDILLYKAKLLKEITKAVGQNGEVVMRCLELYLGSFVQVSRPYTLIAIDKSVPINFEIYPLFSVHRSVFTAHNLELYLKICNDSEQEVSSQTRMIDFYGGRMIRLQLGICGNG